LLRNILANPYVFTCQITVVKHSCNAVTHCIWHEF